MKGQGSYTVNGKRNSSYLRKSKAPHILKFCSEFASLLYLFSICWVLHIMLSSENTRTMKIWCLHLRNCQQIRENRYLKKLLHYSMGSVKMKEDRKEVLGAPRKSQRCSLSVNLVGNGSKKKNIIFQIL